MECIVKVEQDVIDVYWFKVENERMEREFKMFIVEYKRFVRVCDEFMSIVDVKDRVKINKFFKNQENIEQFKDQFKNVCDQVNKSKEEV